MKIYINLKTKYRPKDKKELINLIDDLSIKLYEIDTSLITDMSHLFLYRKRVLNSSFEGIGLWDVSNVKNMSNMFEKCFNFNQPLNNWNVSNVENMRDMFCECINFNQSLNNWDVAKVKDMSLMFAYCSSFDKPLDKWDVCNVKYMTYMFSNCKSFNQHLNSWNVSKCINIDHMFIDCNIKDEFKPKGVIR